MDAPAASIGETGPVIGNDSGSSEEASIRDLRPAEEASQHEDDGLRLGETNDTENREPAGPNGSGNSTIDSRQAGITSFSAAAESSQSSELRQRRRAAGASENSEFTDEEQQQQQARTTAHEEGGKGKEPAGNDSRQGETDVESKTTATHGSDGSGGEFSCNICFDTATDPVLTICGHLFCWSCLVQWLECSATCPVCKAGCDKDKVIPVYGRGREEKDPRLNPNMPNRPAGQRPPPPPRQHNQIFGFDPFGVPGSFHGMGRAGGGGGGAVFVGGFGLLPALMGFSTFSTGHMGNLPMGSNGAASGQQS
ncbi:hypothetical protein GGI04_005446, partial [Coemansia thaxteri]